MPVSLIVLVDSEGFHLKPLIWCIFKLKIKNTFQVQEKRERSLSVSEYKTMRKTKTCHIHCLSFYLESVLAKRGFICFVFQSSHRSTRASLGELKKHTCLLARVLTAFLVLRTCSLVLILDRNTESVFFVFLHCHFVSSLKVLHPVVPGHVLMNSIALN